MKNILNTSLNLIRRNSNNRSQMDDHDESRSTYTYNCEQEYMDGGSVQRHQVCEKQ
jgi:hypothetical protein